MGQRVIAAIVAAMWGLAACAAQGTQGTDAASEAALESPVIAALYGDYQVSDAALATAVRGSDGRPVGMAAYATPRDAIEAGDMAAFIAMMQMAKAAEEAPDGIGAFVLAVDRIAAGDYPAARAEIEAGMGTPYGDQLGAFASAWLQALEGDVPAAVSAHRRVSSSLPGLTGELSLAALLEAAGREDEALAVYSALTPARIEAPDHEFDPQGLVFTHIQMVVSRRTLLLHRLGRIEEAKDVYLQLADAEPEREVHYAAAIESLETGRGIDTEPLTMKAAFARSISDLSLALYQQTLIRNAMLGKRLRGLNEQRATFDQLALLIDPGSETLREIVVGTLANEALYDGAAHSALTAPEPQAGLQIAAAQALLMKGELEAARDAISGAIEIAEEDEQVAIYSGAIGLHALMGDEARALSLADAALDRVTNPAEEASLHGLKANTLQQFGRHEEAVRHAQQARELDDTHERRMTLANLMGEAGMIEEAIRLLQIERLKRPNDPYMLNSYGYFLLQHTERYAEAFKVLYLANGLASNNPFIADSLGWAYYRLGHLDEARRLIELAQRELAPQRHWEIEDHLGDILWHLGERKAAREAWKTALGEFPPDATREAVEAKLRDGVETPPPPKQALPSVKAEPAGSEPQET